MDFGTLATWKVQTMLKHGRIWKEEAERELQVPGVRRWRELVADRKKMEGHCSTGQSPQWAVVPMEEEEEDGFRASGSYCKQDLYRICNKMYNVGRVAQSV